MQDVGLQVNAKKVKHSIYMICSCTPEAIQ